MSTEVTANLKVLLSALMKSPHGKLAEYLPVCEKFAAADPDLFAHTIAYNHVKGQVRDAKVALPVIQLLDQRVTCLPYVESALAHLADLRPREFLRALEFARDIKAPTRLLRRLVERYLIDLEQDRREWDRTALQHRGTLRALYAKWAFTAPGRAKNKADWTYEKAVLFGEAPYGTVFSKLKTLKDLDPAEIAGTIMRYQIPFLIAQGALGAKAKDPDVVMALIGRMSSTELVTNMKWLERVGVKTVPALRAALEEALGKAGKSRKAPKATFKTTTAAEAVADDDVLSGKLRVLQEKQIERLATIEGDWLVLGDKSGSMEKAIETARMVAATLARMVKGKVHLVFFDDSPRYFDATGKTYEALQQLTAGITANGATSIGCGLEYCRERGIQVDGIAIVGDGCENRTPQFADAYAAYAKKFDTTPTVYFYRTATSFPAAALGTWGLAAVQHQANSEVTEFLASCKRSKLDLQTFDLTGGTDYYALPSIIQTCRVQRYSLLDEILGTPLRMIDDVLDRTIGMKVLAECRVSTPSLTR